MDDRSSTGAMLSHAAVGNETLDARGGTLSQASGFIRGEAGRLWLYTCWHVVTGVAAPDARDRLEIRRRRFLRVAFQPAEALAQQQPLRPGGLQMTYVPLYDLVDGVERPRWWQDARHVPHPVLNAVGLFVPAWHDLVKVELPSELAVSDLHLVCTDHPAPAGAGLAPPARCVIVGHPARVDADGAATRAIVVPTTLGATQRAPGGPLAIASGLEACMPGGPVFLEGGEPRLFGIHVGAVDPDRAVGRHRHVTALGIVHDLTQVLAGTLPMLQAPRQPAV